MSATNRGAEREEADFYPTPAWPVDRLVEAVELPRVVDDRPARWIEPCVGDGAIVRAFDWQPGPRVDWTTVDIRPQCRFEVPTYVSHHVGDYRALAPRLGHFDVCPTNPPFFLALQLLRELRRWCRIVAFLLRLNWLEGPRAPYLRRPGNMPDVYVLPQRPKFKEKIRDKKTGKLRPAGTDATAYSWMVWGGPLGGGQIRMLEDTPKAVRALPGAASRAAMQRALSWLDSP